MEIKDLEVGAKGVEVEIKVAKKGEIKEFERFGSVQRVCNLTVEDNSGSIEMSLWGDDIEKVKAGDRIKVINGFVAEFKGTPQLNPGKYGKVEIVEKKE